MTQPVINEDKAGPPPALRGGRRYPLAKGLLVLGVSFLNLLGAFLAIATLGGLGGWSRWQFIGLFGVIEAAMGLAFILGPNIWRLPAAQANTSRHTDVRLTPEVLLVPQWGGAAKVAAGLVMVLGAGFSSGWSPASATLALLIPLVALAVLALSLVVARWGVARPDLDVVSFVIRRPERPDRELHGMSIGGMVIQLITQVGVFPLVKLTEPAILYDPSMRPSGTVLLGGMAAATATTVAALIFWRGRMGLGTPREQEAELERELSA